MPDSLTVGILSTSEAGPSLSVSSKDSPEKIRDAATQFESLLIGQILKSAHEDEGWLGTGDDQTAGAAMGMADEYFARAMAARGGLGLANTIAAGLKQAEKPLADARGSVSATEPRPCVPT
jgi:Rod binding domain-containing protein